MQFLVRIQVDLPATFSEDERAELLAAELKRGRELRDSGAIVSIWRVPGPPLRNVGIWEAADATELHELLASLPLSPHIQAEVTPLAQHPINASDGGD